MIEKPTTRTTRENKFKTYHCLRYIEHRTKCIGDGLSVTGIKVRKNLYIRRKRILRQTQHIFLKCKQDLSSKE